jgi:hypothetical protein
MIVLLIFFLKGSLEALEVLLKTGYSPNRGFFLAFGHDEEVLNIMRLL